MSNTTEQEIRTCQGIPFSGPMVKGDYGGLCNIAACQKPDAIYYNHESQKYYCPVCAEKINKAHIFDVEKIDNDSHDLCTAPHWLVTFVNEFGQICECYVKAYDYERVEQAWVKGDYESYRALSGEGESTWDESCDEDNILSMERDGINMAIR